MVKSLMRTLQGPGPVVGAWGKLLTRRRAVALRASFNGSCKCHQHTGRPLRGAMTPTAVGRARTCQTVVGSLWLQSESLWGLGPHPRPLPCSRGSAFTGLDWGPAQVWSQSPQVSPASSQAGSRRTGFQAGGQPRAKAPDWRVPQAGGFSSSLS